MFPIRNARGNLVGFGGRVIGKGEPKYLNSPDTPIFSKGLELYGLWEGRAGIRAEGCVLVVEGYMDVVGLAQSGLCNAVATLGTSTTPQHVQKLLRASDRVIFSFDGDKAGRRAAWRALQNCLPLLRDDVSIRFLFLPDDHDPDSYVRAHGAQAFRELMGQAPALSTFMLDELTARHTMAEAEGRAACVHEARPLLAQLPQASTLKVQIEREFARRVLLTPEELSAMLVTPDVAGRRPDAVSLPVASITDPSSGMSGPFFESHEPDSGFDGQWVPDMGDDNWQGDPGMFFPEVAAPVTAPSFKPWQAKEQGRRKGRAPVAGRSGNRSVTSMAKRLLRLLVAHPELVDTLGDQQLETLARVPNLTLVRDLIALISDSGARHAGALLEAADPDSDLAAVLSDLGADLLGHDDLPDPKSEWNDALHKVELDLIKSEQSQLIADGLKDAASRERYQLLGKRLAQLGRA